MQNSSCLLLVGVIFCLFVTSSTADVTSDVDELVSVFHGLYDNIDQYKSDIAKGLPPQERHMRYTSYIAQQQLQIFPGRRHLYIQQWVNGNRSQIVRQRLYSFAHDPHEGVNMKIYKFQDPSKVLNAPPNATVFWNLKENDVTYTVGCDVTWHRKQESPTFFQSSMGNKCFVNINGQRVSITDENNVTETYFTIDEMWTYPNGTKFRFNPLPYNLTKQHVHFEAYFNSGGNDDSESVQVWVVVIAAVASVAVVALAVSSLVCFLRRKSSERKDSKQNASEVDFENRTSNDHDENSRIIEVRESRKPLTI